MLVLFSLSTRKFPNSSTNLKPMYGLLHEYGGLYIMRIFIVFVPILICHCENSKVISVPLLTKDAVYPSLFIMPVTPPILSSLGIFLKQYHAFFNLFMLSQFSSFTHVSVGKQKCKSSSIQWCNIISSFPLISLGLPIAILTHYHFIVGVSWSYWVDVVKIYPLFVSHFLLILSFALPPAYPNFHFRPYSFIFVTCSVFSSLVLKPGLRLINCSLE